MSSCFKPLHTHRANFNKDLIVWGFVRQVFSPKKPPKKKKKNKSVKSSKESPTNKRNKKVTKKKKGKSKSDKPHKVNKRPKDDDSDDEDQINRKPQQLPVIRIENYNMTEICKLVYQYTLISGVALANIWSHITEQYDVNRYHLYPPFDVKLYTIFKLNDDCSFQFIFIDWESTNGGNTIFRTLNGARFRKYTLSGYIEILSLQKFKLYFDDESTQKIMNTNQRFGVPQFCAIDWRDNKFMKKKYRKRVINIFDRNKINPLEKYKKQIENLLKQRKYNRYGVDKEKLRKDINIVSWEMISGECRNRLNASHDDLSLQQIYEFFCDEYEEEKKDMIRIVWNGFINSKQQVSFKYDYDKVFNNDLKIELEEEMLKNYNKLTTKTMTGDSDED